MMRSNKDHRTKAELLEEIEQLRARLEEAEQTLDAIRSGDVDALVVAGPQGDQVFSLTGAERTYRLIVETMNEAALTVDLNGVILFCNQRFLDLLKCPLSEAIGRKLTAFAASAQKLPLKKFLADVQGGPAQRSLTLRAADGGAVSVQLAASPLLDAGHASICLVASDLTELEAQADSIRVMHGHQQALEESRAELQDANAALSQSRLAALNVSEDAIAARQQAEELTSHLQREVRERQQAEQALRESESLFRSLFENSLDAVLLTIPDGRVLSANPAACSMFGMSEEEIIRVGRAGLSDPDDPKHAAALGERKKAQRIGGIELEYIRKNGQRFPAEVDSVILPGEPQRSFVIIRDITERKRAEEATRAERQLLETVLYYLPTGIDVIQGNDLRIKLVNPAYQAIAPGKEMLGKTLDELWPETNQTFVDLCRRVLDTGEPYHVIDELNMIRRSPDGPLERAYFTWSLYRIQLSGDEGWAILNTTWETTERMLMVEKLQASEEQFRTIFELSAVGKAQTDPATGRFLLVNDLFCKITGYSQEELLQKTFAEITHPDDRANDMMLIEEAKKQKKPTWVSEKRYIRKDGVIVWVVVSGSMLLDHDGHLYRSIAAISDITERKRAEEQIKASLAEKEVLLREIHHRVKNNLQVISSLVSLQSDNLTDERMRDELNDVRDRVRSMALIHEKLYQTSDLAQLNFADYATSLLHYLWRSHGTLAAKVRLNLMLAPVVLSIEAAVPCGLILNELAGNALKHAFPKDSDGEVTVGLAYDSANEAVCLRVSDNGVGLPAGLDWQQSRSLGLRLVRILTGQLHGAVETGTGPGAEFRVTFPLKGFQS